MHLVEVRDRVPAFQAEGARILAIAFAPPSQCAAYRQELNLPFPVASDPERRAYRAFGLGRGSAWDIWHPRVLWKYLTMLRRGERLRRSPPGEDLRQLGGDFVVDGAGIVRFAHPSRRPDDRPDPAVLLQVVRRYGRGGHS